MLHQVGCSSLLLLSLQVLLSCLQSGQQCTGSVVSFLVDLTIYLCTLAKSSKELYNVHCSWTLCRKLARMYAGGRKKPVPKVTITELNRRVTGEAKDFDEVIAQARRVSQGGDM